MDEEAGRAIHPKRAATTAGCDRETLIPAFRMMRRVLPAANLIHYATLTAGVKG
jgi:hypothetical protein